MKYLVFSGVAFEIVGLLWLADIMAGKFAKTAQERGKLFIIIGLIFMVIWVVQLLWLAKRLEKDEES